MRRLWSWWSSKKSEPERKIEARACRPSLDALDKRELPAVTAITLSIVPNVLTPPNNTYQQVHVSGTITDNRGVAPTTDFVIVDLYRQDEPRAPLTLTPTSTPNQYSFSTSFYLHARRADHSKPGRFYYFILQAGDQDGATSRVLPILVPHGLTVPKPPPPPKHKYQFTNRAGALIIPNTSSNVNPFANLFAFRTPNHAGKK